MYKYHFGIPGTIIWSTHIVMGLFFAYIGYRLLNKQPIGQAEALTLMFLGMLAFLYHAHLWVYTSKQN